ncbi:hypothetical protein [Limnobaculum xujianqingii]|uniref:hypothetical protein n=1 Tax=Limnobaculum xujianqingii TaxID=2738837 RepID=UPI00112714CA|nr:hypothetical protein [Limnobaculum xujianqingii]
MKLKVFAATTLLISPLLFAGQVDNSAMVKKYHAQLEDVKSLLNETIVTTVLSVHIADAYRQFGGVLPEVTAHSKHIQRLKEDAEHLFGNALTETPFPNCRELVYDADKIWGLRLDLAKTNKTPGKEISSAEDKFVKAQSACVNEIKTPPPAKKDESKTAIIDITS